MLGQSQRTSLFFSGQRLEAVTLSFPPRPYTFAVQKERLLDGVKDTEKGSRMTRERQGKGMDKGKRCATCTPEQTQAVCYMAKIRLRCFASGRQCGCTGHLYYVNACIRWKIKVVKA